MPVAKDLKIMPQLKAIIEEKETSFDVIIIGGGPAGLTAAIYASRAGIKTLLIEKAILGGTISSCSIIENYPGFPGGINGAELGRRMEDQARKFGCEIVWGDCTGIEKKEHLFNVNLSDRDFLGRSVIIATGTQPKKLNVPGEDEFRGRGVSYCAICDGAFYRDKNIAVIGGGNSAVSEALFLTRFASRLAVVHRRDKLRADKIIVDRAHMDPKIFFIWNSTLEKISGSNFVEEIEVRNVIDNKKNIMKVDGVFIYVGETPSTAFLKGTVNLSEDGSIIVDSLMKTSVDGIFAAGDVCKKTLRQITTAVSDGSYAALSVQKYLENML